MVKINNHTDTRRTGIGLSRLCATGNTIHTIVLTRAVNGLTIIARAVNIMGGDATTTALPVAATSEALAV